MSSHDDILAFNRRAGDRQVRRGNSWTIPVGTDAVERARRGDWSILLTPTKPVPAGWFPRLAGADVLCLAGGGGQQGPTLAAAGASVTVLDNSPEQLARTAWSPSARAWPSRRPAATWPTSRPSPMAGST